ncbi:DNA topoisomerase family protein [Mycobacterium xenopi 4042]|uniref:DNA topoisomerase family protein n=1 Tax=Mycobacterium xenopi 4042 TaxID=1299334 RepID=X7ZX55_MYCXE|nr:DNA topoisomerase family protein [Mycobacterium xenopi 4042]
MIPDQHSTNPPPRYTEASLVKALEELGIGRPSTYSSIIKTIQDRGYVYKKGSALVPSWVAFAVTGLLEQHFGRLVDYEFTAAMEDGLDEIAAGHEHRTNWLSNFYFGGDYGVPVRWRVRGLEEAGRRQPRRHRRARSQLHQVV